MRKIVALLLIVVLVFALATAVCATGNNPSPTGSTATDPSKPTQPVSPNTGDMALLLAPVMLLGLFGLVVATRKLVKNH